MAAVNKTAWRYNVSGAKKPVRQRMLVAAGSSKVILQGEICFFDAATEDLAPVTGATVNLHALMIADEEQKAGDAARFLWFIVPTEFDVFEFALDAGTSILWGDELQISDSQTLKKSGTDPIAQAVDVLAPNAGVTWPTITKVLCKFYKAAKAAAGLELPWLGNGAGDAA